MMKEFYLLLVLACGSELAASSRILFLVPYGSPSHAIFYHAVLSRLAERNHFIRIVSSVEVMGQEYKHSVRESVIKGKSKVSVPNFLKMRKDGSAHRLVFQLAEMGYPACENFLKSQEMKDVLKEAKEKPFDLLLTGSLLYECAMPYAHIFSIPRVMLSSASILPWLDYALGNPQQWAFVPNLYLGYSDHMSFWQRFYNSMFSLTVMLHRQWLYLPNLDSIVQEHLGVNIPRLSELDQQVSLVLANFDPSMDYPRPIQPNVIQLGGVHLNSSQALPKALKTFMDESETAGVVVFSMGSVINESHFFKDTLHHLAEAFKSIPQRVIWKWNMSHPPVDSMPQNILLIKWLPQQAILAHPKVKVFITHGGLGSSLEAVYNGIPIIGIPVFADQDYNVVRAARDGSGIFLEYGNITKESLVEAINKVIHDNRYKDAMLKRSNILRDKFVDPLAQGVYYIEYVIRHNGASHLRPASLELPWYQLYLIDVFLVAAIFLSLSFIAAVKLLIALFHITKKNVLNENEVLKDKSKKVKFY